MISTQNSTPIALSPVDSLTKRCSMTTTDHANQVIAGSLACINALITLEKSAKTLPEAANDAAVYYGIQEGDAKALADVFGPMTPQQEGAMRTLAEYIHSCFTTGYPDLTGWTPTSAHTPAEMQDIINHSNAQD